MTVSKILFLLFMLKQGICYQQNDYTVTNERFEIINVNKEYGHGKLDNIMYNRTTRAANITLVFLKDFGNQLEVYLEFFCLVLVLTKYMRQLIKLARASVQGYKFSSNEYRLFPIVLTVNFCDVIGKDTFGAQNIYNCGNFTKCPFKKGTYVICNWTPDESKLPPYHPRGRFMAEIKVTYLNKEIAELRWYTKVESKVAWN